MGNMSNHGKIDEGEEWVDFWLHKLILRNHYSRTGKKVPKGYVNLEYYTDALNLGDYLSFVVCEYMLSKRLLSFSSKSKNRKTMHLMAIGSILGGRGDFNATVWGSGIRNFSSIYGLGRKKFYQKLDIRAVRGPLTRYALIQGGFKCPDVFGDPAILMPLIYKPNPIKCHKIVLVLHYLTPKEKYERLENITILDIQTKDYKEFIDVIASAEKVVSSSLHGIILAETYGTPAVFLSQGIESELLKFYDWYYSTGRMNVQVASTIDEAIEMEPMTLPELAEMKKQLLETFPYDLW